MPIGKGVRPCFLGSTDLGKCHLGNLTIWLRDSTVCPSSIAYLPRGIIRGITCLRIVTGDSLWGPKPCRVHDHWNCLGKDCTLCLGKSVVCQRSLGVAFLGDSALYLGKSAVCLGRPGTSCLGDSTLCLGKSVICQGSLGVACLGDCTLCLGKSAIYWGSLGIACLGDSTLCQSAICLGILRGSPRSYWPACLRTVTCLWGPSARVTCLLFAWQEALVAGKTWELCQVILPSPVIIPSFLFSRLLNFLTCLSLTLVNLVSLTFSINSWHCW